uniref:hypothetical protein n=1 Tax=Bacillus multifaciens TaxID=3068506 RepID=UPI003F497AC7
MGREHRERYIKTIANVVKTKRKNTIGYLVVGEKNLCTEIQKDIICALDEQGIISCHLDFYSYDHEDKCIAALKAAKKELSANKDSKQLLILVIESFDRIDTRIMDAVNLLIGCRAVGIHLLVSANTPMVHLVGLTEYLITMNPSEEILSKFYRYSNQKVLCTLYNDPLSLENRGD